MPENVTDADLKSYADGYTLTTNIPFTADEAPVSATPQTWTDVSFEVPAVKPTDRLIIYATVDGTEKGGKARYEVDDIEVVPSSVKPVTVVFEDTFDWVNTSVDWANKLEAYKDNWAVFDGRVYAKYYCLQFGTGSAEAGITTHALTELGATPTDITVEAQLTGNAANKQSASRSRVPVPSRQPKASRKRPSNSTASCPTPARERPAKASKAGRPRR